MWYPRAVLTACLAVQVTASTWFPGTKAAYNKWHETELERWLSDNNIPYPKAADRKDMEDLVAKNWNDYVVEPYNKWSPEQLYAYLSAKGKAAASDADDTAESLIAKVKESWFGTADSANKAMADAKEWALDSWSDSQLKALCDRNGISVPNPRNRDVLIGNARRAYELSAKKAGETAAYPGNWLYEGWSDSDLKSWLDKHGVAVPQGSNRNKLVAAVRRNSHLAYLKAQDEAENTLAKAKAVYAKVSDEALEAWDESKLQKFCDENGIAVPHGTRPKELRALIRKNRAEVMGSDVHGKATKAFGAATSKAGNQFAKATDDAALIAQREFEQAVDKWSNSRLKSYLDARGIPIPQNSGTDELRALVRKHAHKASTGWSAWTFDDFNKDNLKSYLSKHGNAAAKAAAKKKDVARDDLLKAAQSAYSSASTAGGAEFAAATNYLSEVNSQMKNKAFDKWSETELKKYLDSYGVPVPQGSKIEDLKALARKQSTYFKYGTSSPGGTLYAKVENFVSDTWGWISQQLRLGSDAATDKAAEAHAAAKEKAAKLQEEL